MKKGSFKRSFFLFYKIMVNNVNTRMLITAIVKTTFNAHLTHVEYSTLARASPPIIAPQVGVIRFTSPFADTIVITVTSVLKVSCDAKDPIIGADNVASPDDDGTKTDKTICNK